MILVDSSVWIDYLRGRSTQETDYFDRALDRERIAVGDLIVAEVLQGCDKDREFNEARAILAAFEQLVICDEEIAVEAARNFRHLRSQGVTIRKTIDTLIATRCIANGLPLLFSDRDFQPFVDHLGLKSAMATGSH